MEERVLAPQQSDRRRPFTAVALYERDLCIINSMLEDVRALMFGWEAGTRPVVPHRSIAWTVHGLKRRIIVCEPDALFGATELHVVGFLAERNRDVDIGPLETANSRIVKNFRDYPGILSYGSRQLSTGDWVNLVLNDAPRAAENWRNCEAHSRAVAELSPRHYRNVRIHSGRLPGGLAGSRAIAIDRTRYVDYGGRRPWRAVRDLTAVAVG